MHWGSFCLQAGCEKLSWLTSACSEKNYSPKLIPQFWTMQFIDDVPLFLFFLPPFTISPQSKVPCAAMFIPVQRSPAFQPIGTNRAEKRRLFSDWWACWPQRRCLLQRRSKDWRMLEVVCNGSAVPDTIWLILAPITAKKKKKKRQRTLWAMFSERDGHVCLPGVVQATRLAIFFPDAKYWLSSAADGERQKAAVRCCCW